MTSRGAALAAPERLILVDQWVATRSMVFCDIGALSVMKSSQR
ncbi:MAG TPA: hypothetical protein PLR44_04800 [Thermomicrobiales bacterium]|nr:hypothetical protein [Thermomicrobiales bacterium]